MCSRLSLTAEGRRKQMSAQLALGAVFLTFLLLYVSTKKKKKKKAGFQRSAPKAAGVAMSALVQFAAVLPGPKGQSAYRSKIIFNKIKYINE